jgi:hypothetical protein
LPGEAEAFDGEQLVLSAPFTHSLRKGKAPPLGVVVHQRRSNKICLLILKSSAIQEEFLSPIFGLNTEGLVFSARISLRLGEVLNDNGIRSRHIRYDGGME